MKKSKFIKLLIICLLPGFVLAQKTISGTVTDNTGQPLPGASVLQKGTTKGAVTDFDGKYSLTVDSTPTTLVYGFLGYKSKEITVDKQTQVNVVLQEDTSQLDEVVVIGYGTARKSDITGSVTSVEVTEAAVAQNTTVDQLLQGRAAGVQVTQNGTPGSGVSVRIRGSNSLRGNNEPLYVVDGVIISSAGEDAANAGGGNDLQENQNGLNGINPRDIESIEVLKDASATAIYGSRGANGVILITTKKGKVGKASIGGFVTSSVSVINERIDVLDGVDFAKYQNEANLVDGLNPQFHIEGNDVFRINYNNTGATIEAEPVNQVNWHDEIYKQGFSKSIGANFSGGNDSGSYYASITYNDQGGIVDNSRFQSGNFNINLSKDLSEKLKLDARLNMFYSSGQFAQDGDRAGGQRSFINNLITFRPFFDEQSAIDDDEQTSNPYSWVNDFQDLSEERRLIGNIALTYDLGKGLKYKVQAGGNIRDKSRDRFYGLTTFQGSTSNGELQMSSLNSKAYQINNLLLFNRNFNKKHRINAVAGLIYDVRDTRNELYAVTDFSTLEFGADQPAYGQVISRPLEVRPAKTQLLSYLGRATYTFNNKYIFTGTFRADGSSKFSKENRFSYFPSLALAWRAGSEKFLRKSKLVSDLKFRAGWGMTGNQGIQPYQTLSNYGPQLYGNPDNGTSVGFIPLNIGNRDLKWETTEQINVGVDFGFFNDRISGTVDVYSKETQDLLQLENLGPSAGFESVLVNRGNIENKGLEVTLSGLLVNKDGFTFEVGGNIAFNQVKISKLGSSQSEILIDGTYQQRSFYLGDNISSGTYFKAPANAFIQGEEIGLFYGWETDGIWQTGDTGLPNGFQPGDIRIIDQNGDGEIDGNDRTIIGNPNPDFTYGGFLDFKYKRLSLNVLVNGVQGNDIANGNNIKWATPGGTTQNIFPYAYHNAWRPDAPSNTVPRIGYRKEQTAISITDRIIEDGSFLRISNITLGYDIPVENSNTFANANIYVSGVNMFTFTKYSGYNPEITSFSYNGNILGVDWLGMPNVRTVILGLNLNF